MSRTPFSLLILKRLSPPSPTPRPRSPSAGRRYSSASPSAPSPEPPLPPPPKPSNLSARLSFVFDQIDAIEKERERSQKDETLQRIRAWREAKGGGHVARGAGAEAAAAEPGPRGASGLDGGDGEDEGSRGGGGFARERSEWFERRGDGEGGGAGASVEGVG
ncbi:hypothetical protein NL676_030806 [Syzygium grande]|nr:hypothetical protein NL676_030806 [Syzygium grande]